MESLPSFEWEGSVCKDFEDELECMTAVRKMLKASLSKKKRGERSVAELEKRQRHIEALLNEHIMRLDIHNSALKHDRRRLQTVNLGIATFLSETASAVQEQKKETEEAIEKKRVKLQRDEVLRRQEIDKALRDLRAQLSERVAEAERAERQLQMVKDERRKVEESKNEYKRYEEWVALNEEQNRLTERAEELERTYKEMERRTRPEPFQFPQRQQAPWGNRPTSFFPAQRSRFNP